MPSARRGGDVEYGMRAQRRTGSSGLEILAREDIFAHPVEISAFSPWPVARAPGPLPRRREANQTTHGPGVEREAVHQVSMVT